jgi:hypothetical protein
MSLRDQHLGDGLQTVHPARRHDMHDADALAVPPAAAAALRAALDGVRHAQTTAWSVGLAVLAEASGNGHIRQRQGMSGPASSVVTSALGTAEIIPGSIGDRAALKIRVAPEAYERIRGHLLEECFHDHDCECEVDPWPGLDELPRDAEVPILSIDGDPRGTATRSPLGRGDVTLALNEDVFRAAEVLRIASALAHRPRESQAPRTDREDVKCLLRRV